MVLDHLASESLNPPSQKVEEQVARALDQEFSHSEPPYIRFPHDGEREPDAFFRLKVSKQKGTQKHIITLHYGTFKTSLQHLYGGTEKGKTVYLNISDWISANLTKQELEKWAPKETPAKAVNESILIEKALKHNEEKRKLEEYSSTLSLVESIDDHPYLQHKRIDIAALKAERKLYLGVLVTKDKKELAIPIFSPSGDIQGYSRIFADLNSKGKFRKGNIGLVSGGYTDVGFLFGKSTEVCLCEGWANAVAYYILTGIPSFCCFGSSNATKALKAILIRHTYINSIQFCDDGDEAAEKAFKECLKFLEEQPCL
jgi:hypothetical protein